VAFKGLMNKKTSKNAKEHRKNCCPWLRILQ
jgi:hypothetical protein